MLLYLLSMFLPVTSGSHSHEFLGYQAALASYAAPCCAGAGIVQEGLQFDPTQSDEVAIGIVVISGAVINSSMLLLPLIAIKNRPRIRWAAAGLILFSGVLAAVLPVLFRIPFQQSNSDGIYEHWGIGYYVWTLSFFIVGAGMLMRCRFPGLDH